MLAEQKSESKARAGRGGGGEIQPSGLSTARSPTDADGGSLPRRRDTQSGSSTRGYLGRDTGKTATKAQGNHPQRRGRSALEAAG